MSYTVSQLVGTSRTDKNFIGRQLAWVNGSTSNTGYNYSGGARVQSMPSSSPSQIIRNGEEGVRVAILRLLRLAWVREDSILANLLRRQLYKWMDCKDNFRPNVQLWDQKWDCYHHQRRQWPPCRCPGLLERWWKQDPRHIVHHPQTVY